MIVGGQETYSLPGTSLDAVELVSFDLDNPVPPCLTDLNNFPVGITGAAGSVGEGSTVLILK